MKLKRRSFFGALAALCSLPAAGLKLDAKEKAKAPFVPQVKPEHEYLFPPDVVTLEPLADELVDEYGYVQARNVWGYELTIESFVPAGAGLPHLSTGGQREKVPCVIHSIHREVEELEWMRMADELTFMRQFYGIKRRWVGKTK